MALPLNSTAGLHGAICVGYMNPPRQAWELKSSSSHTFPLRTHTGRFGCMKAYVPNLPSSVRLATTSFRAHMEEVTHNS